jgi:plasmid stabilization system protein ParE
MRVLFTPRAQASVERMVARWRDNAEIPEVFAEDLRAVIQRLETMPTAALVAKSPEGKTVYRVSTDRTKLHLYYRIEPGTVVVLQVWSQFRPPPKL